MVYTRTTQSVNFLKFVYIHIPNITLPLSDVLFEKITSVFIPSLNKIEKFRSFTHPILFFCR